MIRLQIMAGRGKKEERRGGRRVERGTRRGGKRRGYGEERRGGWNKGMRNEGRKGDGGGRSKERKYSRSLICSNYWH